MDFYVSFTGTPEEIAALVEKLQERQPAKQAEITIDGKPVRAILGNPDSAPSK